MVHIFGLLGVDFLSQLLKEPVELLKYVIVFVWLKIRNRRRRLHSYDPCNHTDLTKLGTILPPAEKELDPPKKEIQPHATDSVLIYGGHSSGDSLTARICRESDGNVLWLFLKLSDGRLYELQNTLISYPASHEFVAGGLKIKCLTPMRKWRLSFNGLLRESRDGETSHKIVHVKCSFICISTSFPFDLSTDINESALSSYICKNFHGSWPTDPRRVTKYLDRHLQAVNIIGTVSIESSTEVELNLWGAKLRTTDVSTCRQKQSSSLFELLGYSKEGQLIYSGEYNVSGTEAKLSFGHLVEKNGLSWPTISCNHHGAREQFSGVEISLHTERTLVSAIVSPPSMSRTWPSGTTPGHSSQAHFSQFRFLDGDAGHALVLNHAWNRQPATLLEKPSWEIPRSDLHSTKSSQPLLLELEDLVCCSTSLAGGKGSSLAVLTYLSKKYNPDFIVPSGFVVTTAAYEEFCCKSGLHNIFPDFENKIRETTLEKRADLCQMFVRKISEMKLPTAVEEAQIVHKTIIQLLFVRKISGMNLPATVEDAIRRQLRTQFAEEHEHKAFAVRSSSSGEDGEETSAAGQMTTTLGVKGIDNILKAVVSCWASQFSLTAIQYKRQYGQEMNSPMAVVVQEMVEGNAAGVLFTCDPVTGNTQDITITANYGLGESVVSGSVDPDTLVINRNRANELSPENVKLGKKTIKLEMSGDGKIVEKPVSDKDSKVCCISPENATLLTQVCVKIEEAYGFPIDVEWAIREKQLYILQARPITTFDQETWYELAHAVDHGMRAEDEYNTRANIAEVLPGAISHFGLTYFFQYFLYMIHDLYAHRNKYTFPFNPFQSTFPNTMNNSFISMPYFVLRFYQKGAQSLIAESNIISGFGRLIHDKEMFERIHRRNQCYPPASLPYQLFMLLSDLVLAERRLNRAVKRLWREDMDLTQCQNSREMLEKIWKRTIETVYGPSRHLENTMISSIYTGLIMYILADANKGWNTTVYNDMALLLTSCGDVESVDIPLSIQLLLKEIKKCTDADKFKQMKPEEALKWLETTSTSAGIKFQNFIDKHGHRCMKEYDVYCKPWRMDKIPVVKILQNSLILEDDYKKPICPPSEVLNKLKTPLGFTHRWFLKLLIPLGRRAVLNREKGKSTMIKHFDFARKGFWVLAEQLEKEGRLPEKELMFFLSHHEVVQLIETRSPALVKRAIRRRNIFPELEKIRFPEITKGVPKPINLAAKSLGDITGEFEMKGSPVSPGIVKGIARVAATIEEAPKIQAGEILIAYSTDIAWSPYFPLLRGVATELGGLISHGAVVAREYGLPCIVALENATLHFKTGDTVILDGNKGILKKIENDLKME